jgi:hypothetical protein
VLGLVFRDTEVSPQTDRAHEVSKPLARAMPIYARLNERVSPSMIVTCRLSPGVDSRESKPNASR